MNFFNVPVVRAGSSFAKSLACSLPLALLLQAGAAQAQSVPNALQPTPQQRMEVLGAPFELTPKPDAELSQFIFFRQPTSSGQTGALMVQVNQQLHTVLTSGGYSALCLPVAKVEIRIRQGQRSASAMLDARSAATQYIRFSEVDGRLLMDAVPEAQALPALQSLRLQVHTLSRVSAAKACPANAAALPAAPEVSATNKS